MIDTPLYQHNRVGEGNQETHRASRRPLIIVRAAVSLVLSSEKQQLVQGIRLNAKVTAWQRPESLALSGAVLHAQVEYLRRLLNYDKISRRIMSNKRSRAMELADLPASGADNHLWIDKSMPHALPSFI